MDSAGKEATTGDAPERATISPDREPARDGALLQAGGADGSPLEKANEQIGVGVVDERA